MNRHSQQEDSEDDATSNENDSTSTTERLPSRQSSRFKPEPTFGDEGQQLAIRKRIDNDSDQTHGGPRKQRRKDAAQVWDPNQGFQKAFQRLFKSVEEDVRSLRDTYDDLLPPSQLGGSFWTTAEKEKFFCGIARYGSDNLPSIAAATGSKSQPEVRAYQLLLRDSLQQLAQTGSSSIFDFSDIPATFETGESLEGHLIDYSNDLARKAFNQDVELEYEEFGETWLINEEVAVTMEEAIANADPNETPSRTLQSSSPEVERHRDPFKGEMQDANADGDGSTSLASVPLWEVPGDSLPAAEQARTSELLIPTAFLQLSRQLFMNAGSADNWSTIDNIDSEYSSEPAIWRSAFKEIHETVVSITRKLMRATLLQATSRLRANYNRLPALMVTERDARVAIDLACMDCDRHKYWATVARRCGVHVYSDIRAYRGGRPATKNGVRLTYDEVEAELGLSRASRSQLPIRNDDFVVPEPEDVDSWSDGRSANSITVSEDGDEDVEVNPHEDEEEEGDGEDEDNEDENEIENGGSSEEEALSSEYDANDEETDFLEALDQKASHAETSRLAALLGCPSPAPNPSLNGAQKKKPSKRPLEDEDLTDWRKRVKYRAEWEFRAPSWPNP